MNVETRTDDLRDAEFRLQSAQLAGDTRALDGLLDERLVFTGPDGELYTKEDDLAIHRSGEQTLTKVQCDELSVTVDGQLGVSWFLGSLEGTFKHQPFASRVRYTRTWIHTEVHGWQVLAAHVSAL
jgi:hypothetical protein